MKEIITPLAIGLVLGLLLLWGEITLIDYLSPSSEPVVQTHVEKLQNKVDSEKFKQPTTCEEPTEIIDSDFGVDLQTAKDW